MAPQRCFNRTKSVSRHVIKSETTHGYDLTTLKWNIGPSAVGSYLLPAFVYLHHVLMTLWSFFLSIRSSLREKSPPRVPLSHPTSWITCLEACSQISTDLESRLLLKESVEHARNPSLDRWNYKTSIYHWQSFRYSISTCLYKPAVIFQLQLNTLYLEGHRFPLEDYSGVLHAKIFPFE